MSSIPRVTETCARDPTPRGMHLEAFKGITDHNGVKVNMSFLIKRPSNLEN